MTFRFSPLRFLRQRFESQRLKQANGIVETAATASKGWFWTRMHTRQALRGLRRKGRRTLGIALARLIGPRHYATTLPLDDVATVLICRINGRIGNTMFLTPAIRYLHELLPRASIDLVLAHPEAKNLLSALPGVRRVITFPHKTPQMIGRYLAALRTMRACRYDIAIDPIPESTSGRIVLTLCRARYRLGFAGGTQWAPLTHAVPEPPDVGTMHQAVRPVYLLSRIFGAPYESHSVRLWLPLREFEIAAGRRSIAQVTASDPSQTNANAFGFFAHAASLKLIDRAWWLAFWEAFLALEPQALPVEFLPSPERAPVNEDFACLHVPSLRGLTAAIAATRMFISTDTGPMHLASSTAVPTVALFHASDPDLFRPLKPTDLAIDIAHSSPRAVAYRCQQIWRASRTNAEAVMPTVIRGLSATQKQDADRGRVSRV